MHETLLLARWCSGGQARLSARMNVIKVNWVRHLYYKLHFTRTLHKIHYYFTDFEIPFLNLPLYFSVNKHLKTTKDIKVISHKHFPNDLSSNVYLILEGSLKV